MHPCERKTVGLFKRINGVKVPPANAFLQLSRKTKMSRMAKKNETNPVISEHPIIYDVEKSKYIPS